MNTQEIFLTGATGAVGAPLADAIGPCLSSCKRLSDPTYFDVPPDTVRVIVHAAAETRFNAPRQQLWESNVVGTEAVIAFAKRCPRLERFIHLSTTCVAGDAAGTIAEAPITEPPNFLNDYEHSKWQAELRVADSGLPHISILRIATVAGSRETGAIEREGAIHHCLRWMRRGLVPMLPGSRESRLDLISCERVTAAILAAIRCPLPELPRFAHISGGVGAPPLAEAIETLRCHFVKTDPAWQRGVRVAPEIVDRDTFALFQNAVSRSGDLLFEQINAATAHFLPALLNPKTYATENGDRLAPREPDWRSLVQKVANATS